MESQLLNQSIEEPQQRLNGFRLDKFSVLNWGTFDQKVWQMQPGQESVLLTGNIGSGKSTLVDGLTTLLVPPRKLAFNKAAGAEDKERSLESYFHGFYTSQQDETGKARALGLRKNGHYSVLLAQFYADSVAQYVTLAQVFWLKPGEKKVKRLFVVARQALDITEDFSDFGDKINQLKKQLRTKEQLSLFDSFAQYQQAFSKLLGLGIDGKALALFNQTISMKSVGSVTDFVRQNMLEQPDLEAQLQELERSYDDLKRLHDTVVDARKKVELLTPVDNYGQQALAVEQEKETISNSRELLEPYMASKAVVLYQSRLQKGQLQLQKLEILLQRLKDSKSSHEHKIAQFNDDILNNGGGRLQQLEADIAKTTNDRDNSKTLFNNYQRLVNAVKLSEQLDIESFVKNISMAKDFAERLLSELEQLDLEQDQLKQQLYEFKQQQQLTASQLSALKLRKSNINLKQLDIRDRLCAQLGVEEARLPFVGELIQVKEEQKHWQGAIERVLHNFALSLMVPDDLYQQVCDFVEQTHLGTRLVYYRVNALQDYYPATGEASQLPAKIEIKGDSEHYLWLHKELQQRFNYRCCEQMDDFRRSVKAISRNGQIKSSQFRHEKDDRHQLQDKSRYVLGWSNKEKIQLLGEQYSQQQQQITQLEGQLKQLKTASGKLNEQRHQALNLADFNLSFEQINWPVYSQRIEQLNIEKQEIEQSSDLLASLKAELMREKERLQEIEKERDQALTERGKTEGQIKADQDALVVQQTQFNSASEQERAVLFPVIEQYYQQYASKTTLRIAMLSNTATQLRTKLNEKIQHLEAKRSKKQQQMIAAMGTFAAQFPNDVSELDKSPQALPEYQQMLKRLQEEDLPRHEVRFKEMLNRDTIRSMVLFRSHLDKQEEEIDARIRLINQSLHTLDYQVGTYIEIDSVASSDLEIREFKQRLKHCAELTTEDNLYSEQKFEQVKDLIEQMRNQPKWTEKVVDVRYWHLFNVIERYREDNSEKECYSDSGGKSGGQKEKLAYSILAAAIMLQYGLVAKEAGKGKRHFNLVVIDEAFARGSKDSTRFGLELFKKLGLQLLLVTPLQKLDVIEHYVKHVHFVDQQNNRSLLLNMSIEQYRESLAQHKKLQRYQAMVEQVESK
ncbi:ATP-binding protein [Psychromonas sp.]|uniref:ATP-binding protein n=1 Tax=Psychromonas sp. TaxID=1884585 RepID=UPI003563FFA2